MDVVATSPTRVRSWPQLAWVPSAILLGISLLLVARRLSGALDQPLPAGLLLLTIAVASLTAWVSIRVFDANPHARWAIFGISAGALALLGAALSLPGTSGQLLGTLWTSIVVVIGLLATDVVPRKRRTNVRAADASAGQTGEVEEPSSIEWQRLSRLRTDAGEDRLEGWVRLECAPGQRSDVVHLAFCPPFGQTPVLGVQCGSGPSARFKVTQLLPYAARIEVKLDALPQEPVSVMVLFTATSPAPLNNPRA